jgi:hypothetical protein
MTELGPKLKKKKKLKKGYAQIGSMPKRGPTIQ